MLQVLPILTALLQVCIYIDLYRHASSEAIYRLTSFTSLYHTHKKPYNTAMEDSTPSELYSASSEIKCMVTDQI